MKKNILYYLLFLMPVINLAAQTKEISDTLQIPPLEVFVDSAIKHSPLLKFKELNVSITEQEQKIGKKKWLDYLYVEGAGNYGLFDQLVISETNAQTSVSTASLSKNQQVRYYGGIGLKIPISSIGNRTHELKIKKMRTEQANLEVREVHNSIVQVIIDEYYKLKYMEESMKTYFNIYQTLEISSMKAEKEMQIGQISMNNFALLVSTVGKAKDDYSRSKNNFFAQYRKLQEITGISLK